MKETEPFFQVMSPGNSFVQILASGNFVKFF